jgi:hypothetical protein
MSLLQEWDSGPKSVRRRILQDFVAQNHRKTGPELDCEFADAASLFLTRITAWLRLTYMIGTCLAEQLQALQIFLSASSGHRFLAEFIEVGGVLTVVEILGVKQAREADKAEALKLLTCVASAGRQYKELICESYGVRATAECLARSRSEVTQECARYLLQTLAEGNPKFQLQVYRGLIALLPCSSAKAQHMAAQTLRVVQPIVETAHPSIVDPVLSLLKTLHLEVQYEAIELIQLLMDYEVRDAMLEGLVRLLRPTDDSDRPLEILNDPSVDKLLSPLPIFVQQAAAAKCIGILAQMSSQLADKLLQFPVITNLMFAMGNVDYGDSQRQAAIALEHLCRLYRRVDEQVHHIMGDVLYDRFVADPECLYMKLNAVQVDILVSNKLELL